MFWPLIFLLYLSDIDYIQSKCQIIPKETTFYTIT